MNSFLPNVIHCEFSGNRVLLKRELDEYTCDYIAKGNEEYDDFVYTANDGTLLKTEHRKIKMKEGDKLTLSCKIDVTT